MADIDICRETAERMYRICMADEDVEETIFQMAEAMHEAMFRIKYCQPRCDSKVCKQIDGGNDA